VEVTDGRQKGGNLLDADLTVLRQNEGVSF
jgi:hypothetical protein